MTDTLTPEIASRFAAVALGHVDREYPNKLDHVLEGPQDAASPRALHPIFYGSFDWHSCVHSHWLLAKLHRRFPTLPQTDAIVSLLDAQFTPEKVAGELAYLQRPSSRGFERPYGWAWLLMLQGELERHEDKRWANCLAPLAKAFVERFDAYLPLATYPVRAGVHSNTAFAMTLTLDYARVADDTMLEELCARKARQWYANDSNANVFEPSQNEFLSPALMEAACMSRVLDAQAFAAWFARFLPNLAQGEPATLFTPATVSDRSDGQIAHLDGLNLSRAWCWRLILDRLGGEESLGARVRETLSRHQDSAMEHIAGDYMGEHWLASFALLALDPFN